MFMLNSLDVKRISRFFADLVKSYKTKTVDTNDKTESSPTM